MGKSFAGQILSGLNGHAWELASADLVLDLLDRDHPLYLPMDDRGELLHDYSALDLYLDELARVQEAPELPVNVLPLAKLCRRHRNRIAEGELWSYKLYYLELLAREGKLQPLFWGNVEVLNPAFFPPEVLIHFASGATVPPEDRQPLMQEIWDVHVSDWIRDKVIVRPNSRPWLCHLEYYPQDERGWDEPVFSFSQCLGFVMQPFYCLRDALHTIRRCMTEELWKTSIFSPLPITPDHRKQWHEHSERFSLRHFVRTEQRKRKLAFEDFVGQEKARGHSIREIAEEARDRHLWPYGTPRRSRTKDYDPQAACERAVSRMIATLRVRAARLAASDSPQ
jgi:hypothetical protein